jgi:RNase P/RNase MRP subunit p29
MDTKFKIGNKVLVVAYEGDKIYNGRKGTVVGYTKYYLKVNIDPNEMLFYDHEMILLTKVVARFYGQKL